MEIWANLITVKSGLLFFSFLQSIGIYTKLIAINQLTQLLDSEYYTTVSLKIFQLDKIKNVPGTKKKISFFEGIH